MDLGNSYLDKIKDNNFNPDAVKYKVLHTPIITRHVSIFHKSK
jgi:hypothetical protein